MEDVTMILDFWGKLERLLPSSNNSKKAREV